MFAGGVKADLRPALDRHLQVVLAGGEKHRIAVDVRRERVGLQPLAVQRAIMQSEYAEHGAPEWPVTNTISPAAISKLTSRTAVTVP